MVLHNKLSHTSITFKISFILSNNDPTKSRKTFQNTSHALHYSGNALLHHHTILLKKYLYDNPLSTQVGLRMCVHVCAVLVSAVDCEFLTEYNLSVFYKEDCFPPNISVSFYFVEQWCHIISVSHITAATFLCSRTVIQHGEESCLVYAISTEREKSERFRELEYWKAGVWRTGLHTSIAGCLLFLVSFSLSFLS